LKAPLTHYEYLRRLQNWRDRYERLLDSKPREQSLDLLSHYLVDFQYTRFDDIEVPGQYLEVRNIIYVVRRRNRTPVTGQGQQSELRKDPEIRAQVRELQITRVLLAKIQHAWKRWFCHHVRCSIALRPAHETRGEGHAVIQDLQWVRASQTLLVLLVVHCFEVPYLGRGRRRRETFVSTFLQQFRAVQACD